jgi:hypothetical protein
MNTRLEGLTADHTDFAPYSPVGTKLRMNLLPSSPRQNAKPTGTVLTLSVITLSRGVAADQVWIRNWIYWTLTLLTTNNYCSGIELHIPKVTAITAHLTSQPLLGSGF